MNHATADIPTPDGARYILKLSRHFAHKVPVSFDALRGDVRFVQGPCVMKAHAQSLAIHLQSDRPEGIAAMQFIIDDHLRRFLREALPAYTWTPGVPDAVRPELDALAAQPARAAASTPGAPT
ncbi:DUF2218 domain-containing protein [Aquabacterium sp. OR-4]|uniref:DUF2218 domain-containing protein n=1 Tax=Aquabacterium sp. OR-4 TaxID=2978127 RepID=UPI0028C603A9|nr:DUF2218 domain-containing protein [Aquabacterium sp. OR-4]MDT7839052.1 DUF2218 domain-containing protein [Aquabacterium sp. OR-4]